MSDSSTWPDDFLAKYPLTFAQSRDFSVGAGWRELLTQLCDVIEPILAAMPEAERHYAVQVKEKFGGLRFYMMGCHPDIEAAINVAEALSEKTCEMCGAPGVLDSDSGQRFGWVTVKCQPCREKSRAKMAAPSP